MLALVTLAYTFLVWQLTQPGELVTALSRSSVTAPASGLAVWRVRFTDSLLLSLLS